jgi:eukaryotic-like serine/threonine-protein kinase
MRANDATQLAKLCASRLGALIDGKYRLDELLGAGATGAVYRATNVWVGRECAVKVFHYEGENREMALQRFVREAQIANRVRLGGKVHPNVVDCVDVGRDRDSGRFFTVQEFLRGETLDAFLRGQEDHRVSAVEAFALLMPVIDAVACGHEAGVVHRDLKPENIFLVDDGGRPLAKVLDFGTAQLSDARLTGSSDIMGTPAYMSPESFMNARNVDARTDVWALGVILYEMISGRAPFGVGAETLYAIMVEIASKEPASLAASGLMRAGAWAVIRRCLDRDLNTRYRDARMLQVALDEVFTAV